MLFEVMLQEQQDPMGWEKKRGCYEVFSKSKASLTKTSNSEILLNS